MSMISGRWPALFGLAVGLLVSGLDADSAAPLLLTGQKSVQLGKHVAILEDRSANLSISQVAAKAMADRFTSSTTDIIAKGYTESAFWFRFQVKNQSGHFLHSFLEVDFPAMDRLDLYWQNSRGEWEHELAGDSVPFNERTVRSRSPAFLLELARDEARTLFLRAETGSSMIVPLKLWSDVGYAEKSGIEMFALGSFYGIGLILVAYNFFLLFSVKDFTYVYYIAYVVLLLFVRAGLDGISGLFFWPESVL